jgi:pyruvate dehydrogenase E1 component beta subunit
MPLGTRKLSYSLAINEALHQLMLNDESVFIIGQGVKSPWYVGNTCKGLLEEFGPERIIDTPVSENAMTGAAIGAALVGMKPIVVHLRMDFMMYGLDSIINQAANWRYMFGGRSSVPVVIWGIINRGGEQAAQHSQVLQALFTHILGLKVVMPSTPHDAKGLMIAAVRDCNPVIFIDDRWLYSIEEEVPEEIYEVPIGRGIIRKHGEQVTVVATSFMVHEALKASASLQKEGIDVEVLDLRSFKPMDSDWKTCGSAAEIGALVFETIFEYLKAPVKRVTLPDIPAPASRILEEVYYPTAKNIVQAVRSVIGTKISVKIKEVGT